MRQNKHENFMEHAFVAAKRSHDAETQVGAVLVNNESNAIVAIGFNGFVRGAPDNVLPNTRPDKYEFMMHAEENVVSHCARNGISTLNCTLYCTLSPCARCTRLLWQCGIKNVVAAKRYVDFEKTVMMPDISISFVTTTSGIVELVYGEG